MQCPPGTGKVYYDFGAMIRYNTPGISQCMEAQPGNFSRPNGLNYQDNCPPGQYSPTPGLMDQRALGSPIPCLRCPEGSLALAVIDGVPQSTTNLTKYEGTVPFTEYQTKFITPSEDQLVRYRAALRPTDIQSRATFCEAW